MTSAASTQEAQMVVRPYPGGGIVARHGSVVAVIGEGGEPSSVTQLLSLLQELAVDDGSKTPAMVSRSIAGHFAGAGADGLPPVGVIRLNDPGMSVVLFGDMTCAAQTAAGTQELSGRDAAVFFQATISDAVQQAVIYPGGASPGAANPRWRLDDGVVSGGAVAIAPSGADMAGPTVPAMDAQPQMAAAAEAVPQVQPATQPATMPEATVIPEASPIPEATPVPEPTPIPEATPVAEAAPAPAAAPAADPSVVIVEGVACAQGHFNHPFAVRCSACGESLLGSTRHSVKGPRPPLGSLTLDTGETYSLDGNYVIGREPEMDPAVGAGSAQAIPLDDPEHLVSRVHAEIRLVEWTVEVVDRGSANGVHVMSPEDTEWDRIESAGSRVIQPGTRIALGRRTLVYDVNG